jgi:hypothetical protein
LSDGPPPGFVNLDGSVVAAGADAALEAEKGADSNAKLVGTSYSTQNKTAAGARMYSHALRQGWRKNGPRTDFTQTLLFTSAMPLTQGLIEGKLSTLTEFYLNDQVSQF